MSNEEINSITGTNSSGEIVDFLFPITRKNFDERCVLNELTNFASSNEITDLEVLKYDVFAFGFYEHSQNNNINWGTYFGPFIVWKGDNGETYENPSLSLVTPEMVNYWIQRSNNNINPILKSRYLGLVYDFSKIILGKNPLISIKKDYANSLITIAENDLYNVPVYTFIKIKRAIQVSLLIKDEELIERAKNTLIDYEEKHGEDLFAGLWGHSFDILLAKKFVKLTIDDEQRIIKYLEDRFERLLSNDEDKRQAHRNAEFAAVRLAKYYKKKGLNEEVTSLIKSLCQSIEASVNQTNTLELAGQYNRIHKIYKAFQLNREAKLILQKLKSASTGMHDQMQLIKTEINIPADKINLQIDNIVSGSKRDFFMKYILHFSQDLKSNEEQLKTTAKAAPFSFLINKHIQDDEGRVIAVIGPISSDFEGNLIQQLSRNLAFCAIYQRKVIDKAMQEKKYNKDEILDNVKLSPLFSEKRLAIIERALDAYFVDDFVVSSHLLIPQIEQALRTIIESSGGMTWRQVQNSDVFMVRTFDDILNDEILQQVMGQDMVTQFKVLFTDQRGWNIRNNLCHGLYNFDEIDERKADWIIHSLMFLTLFRTENTPTY